ncbi:MAG: hypothetical protein R2874_07825 [Desulfobacterales bacterium]
MFENITMDNKVCGCPAASNYLPVSGTLQKDKSKMLDAVNAVLETRDRGALRSEQMRGL